MKRLIVSAIFLVLCSLPALAASEGFVVASCPGSLGANAYTPGQYGAITVDVNGNECAVGSSLNTASVTNPSTGAYQLTSATTAYTVGQLIANNATAGSVTNPSFSISNAGGAAAIARLRLFTNDTTSTAWGAQTIQVDLWTAAPTWTNGDRGTWLPATGSASHLGAFTCVMGAVWGDGVAAECYPVVGQQALVKLSSGTTIYASLQAVTGSGVTGASKTFTIIAELQN